MIMMMMMIYIYIFFLKILPVKFPINCRVARWPSGFSARCTLASKFGTQNLPSFLKPIPKPGKDHSQLNGYHILSMQNTIGKLMERITARKLAPQISRTGRYSLRIRGGFRPGKCSWENAAAFAYDVYEGYQRKEQTLAVTIDLEDAYNRVQFKLLIDLLVQYGVSLTLTRWIAGALLERTVVVQLGNLRSAARQLTMGLPQGSPLSPVLYTVCTKGLADRNQNGLCRVLTLADDKTTRDTQEAAEAVQQLKNVSEWCEDTGSIQTRHRHRGALLTTKQQAKQCQQSHLMEL